MRVVRNACEQFEGEARLRDAEPIEVVEHPREEGREVRDACRVVGGESHEHTQRRVDLAHGA